MQRIMFTKFISMLPEHLKNMKPNCLYSTFCGKICHHQANSPQKVEYKQLGFNKGKCNNLIFFLELAIYHYNRIVILICSNVLCYYTFNRS